MRRTTLIPFYLLTLLIAIGLPQLRVGMIATNAAAGPNCPIMFVTQVPVRQDFTTIVATFGNHHGDLWAAPRGGNLWIRYPNGTLKNLTRAAGYGSGWPQYC